MEYQKRSTSKYEVGQFYGCLQLLEKLSNNRWKVKCNTCGTIYELSTSSLSSYSLNNLQFCGNCKKEHKSSKYKPGDILGECFELIEFRGGNDWLVRCIKCGKEQIQSISNMKKHKKDTCYFCEHPTAERNPKSNGGRKGVNLLPIDERIYNYYSSRILQQNEKGSRKYKEWKLTLNDFSSLIHQNCYYCGAEPSIDNAWNDSNKRISTDEVVAINGIDRWDPNKGYTIENCVPCCKYCNRMKSDLQPRDFYYKISLIYKRSMGSTTIEKHESELSRVESSDSKREESDNVSDCEIV